MRSSPISTYLKTDGNPDARSQTRLEHFQNQGKDQVLQNQAKDTTLSVLTRLPFANLQGTIYRSPMPFGPYDPEGRALGEMEQKKVSVVVIMTPDWEAQEKSGRDLRKLYQAKGFEVIYLPAPDYGVPKRESLNRAVQKTIARARQGKNIVVHCSAGIGRTGVFLAEIAKQAMHMPAQSALYWVRLYVKRAVQAEEQERFVMGE